MTEWGSSAALAGLVVEAVEWLPSGADSGLVRVRGRWVDTARRESELPALGLRRADEVRRFDSLPDARFGRDPAVWRGTYLVPSALMDPAPDELWLTWESGARAALPAPVRGFEPPAVPVAPAPPEPQPEGEVIDRAVLAERRARRAEAAERAQAERAAEALKAVEVLELRSAELERRLEAVQSEPAVPVPIVPAAPHPAEAALADALAEIKRLREALGEQRHRLRRSELLRSADAVALASFREDKGRVRRLQAELALRERELADAVTAREQAAEQVAAAARRAAMDAAVVRRREAEARAERDTTARSLDAERSAHSETRERLAQGEHELGAVGDELAERERELAAIGQELAGVRTELATVRRDAAQRASVLERRLAELGAALDAERRAHGTTATERETARASLALSASARSAEAVARAALDEELDRERAARATLIAALDAAQAELTTALTTQSDIALSREQARAEAAELGAARDAATSAEASALERAERLDAELEAARSSESSALERAERLDAELKAARSSESSTLERAASAEASARELAVRARRGRLVGVVGARACRAARSGAQRRPGTDRASWSASGSARPAASSTGSPSSSGRPTTTSPRRAREQAAASAAAERVESGEIAADLDAAAAALRARTEVVEERPAEPVEAPRTPALRESSPAAAPTEPASRRRRRAGRGAENTGTEGVEPGGRRPTEPVESSAAVEPAAAAATEVEAPARPRPTIVTEAKHPPRADVVGTSKRQYPWLRGALVKLAHDDPRAATRLVLGLVPAQRALVSAPLEYDLTIRDSGTYAVSVAEDAAHRALDRRAAAARRGLVPCLRGHRHARRAARRRREADGPLVRLGQGPRPPPRRRDPPRRAGRREPRSGSGRPGRRRPRPRPRLPRVRLRDPPVLDQGSRVHGRPGARRPAAAALVRRGPRRQARHGRAARARAAAGRGRLADTRGVLTPPARREAAERRAADGPGRPRRRRAAQGLDGPRPGPLNTPAR